jgi:hypothetical protein
MINECDNPNRHEPWMRPSCTTIKCASSNINKVSMNTNNKFNGQFSTTYVEMLTMPWRLGHY